MEQFLIGLHIVSAVAIVALVLLQQKGVGLGSAFGGEGTFYRARRGAEKFIFTLTVVSSFLFVASALVVDNFF